MSPSKLGQTQQALASLNGAGLFLLTAQHDGKRAGVVVKSVQPCGDEPPLVCVAVRRGHWIEPIIRDSHSFAVCRVEAIDKLLLVKFSESSRPRDGDPFDCLPTTRLVTGAPILQRATIALDCEVVRHFDLEADHELYIGHVLEVRIDEPAPGVAEPARPPRRRTSA
jgi:flavin reductase (DIM6/NTAB) family NADH-FMN oxidoreductase RutF